MRTHQDHLYTYDNNCLFDIFVEKTCIFGTTEVALECFFFFLNISEYLFRGEDAYWFFQSTHANGFDFWEHLLSSYVHSIHVGDRSTYNIM